MSAPASASASATAASHVPTVFLSAATVDLEDWRNVLHDAFTAAQFRVLTQDHSLGASLGNVRRLITGAIDQSDCVIHLAGMGYGSHATDPFPFPSNPTPAHPPPSSSEALDSASPRLPLSASSPFQCSWTQFEYYYAHQSGKDVIAFVCAPDLSRAGFMEHGDAAEQALKTQLQEAHRDRVKSGKFDGTPLAGMARTCNDEEAQTVGDLLKRAVAATAKLNHRFGEAGQRAVDQLTRRQRLHTLPAPPTGFVGRVTDLEKLNKLDPARGALLTGLRGMGGIGKTALALVLAREWTPRFPDAQIFLDARGTQTDPPPPSARALMEQVIQAFHPEAKLPDDEKAVAAIYRDVLQGKRALILLDNAKDAAQSKPLIPPDGCALIVTSRQTFMLGTTAPHDVGRLPDPEALALLREYHSTLSDPDAAELIKLCAGLPLALRLAGAHLALDASERGGVPDVASYIHALRSGRLATLDRDAPDAGEITISETLRLSEAHLTESDRTAWRALGVFSSSFDARAAEAITNVARNSDFESASAATATPDLRATQDTLDRLVRRSLLDREGDRYKLHDLVAEYACAQHHPEALTALHLAHAQHYVAVGWEAAQLYKKGKVVEAMALFDRERAQTEAAFVWMVGKNESDNENIARVLIKLVDEVAYTSNLRFHPRQLISWLEAQLKAARRVGDRLAEGRALGNLGNPYTDIGKVRKAIEYYEQALVISREFGDRRGEGAALGSLGNAYGHLGDQRKAIVYIEHRLVIARETNDRHGEGNALGNLGLAHAYLGDARKAIEFYDQQLVIAREIGDRRGEGRALGGLGIAHVVLGELHKAVEFFEQRLVIAGEIGDRSGECNAIGNLGVIHSKLGDIHKAIELCQKRLIIAREIGKRQEEGAALAALGAVYYELGDARKAMGFHEQALIISREIGDRRGEGNALWNSALAYDTLGHRAEAVAHAEAALNLYEAIEDPTAATVRATLAEWKRNPPP